MNIVDIYKEAYVSKEASLPWLAQAGLTMGQSTAHALAVALPMLLGAGGGYALSKITDPTDTDLQNYEKEAYISDLKKRLDRVKSLPSANYDSSENTLRI